LRPVFSYDLFVRFCADMGIPPNATELIARLKEGHHDLLGELFSCEYPRLWKMVNVRLDPRLRSRVDADDILQEAYLAAEARLSHFQENTSTSFFIWLRLVVSQTLIDVHRRHLNVKKRDAARDVSIDANHNFQATSAMLARQLLGRGTSPSGAAIREEASQQLKQSLDAMHPIDREVLILRHFEELTNHEVAESLGIEEKAASVRYIRAVRRLREILVKLPGFTEEV